MLVFSTFLDYYTGIRIEKSQSEKGRRIEADRSFWKSRHNNFKRRSNFNKNKKSCFTLNNSNLKSNMENAKKQKKTIDAEIDRLEATFEKNRREMHQLADENKRMSDRYGELLEDNHRINDSIRTLLEQMWKLD